MKFPTGCTFCVMDCKLVRQILGLSLAKMNRIVFSSRVSLMTKVVCRNNALSTSSTAIRSFSHKPQKNLTINEKGANKLIDIDLSNKPIPKKMPSSCGDKAAEEEDEIDEDEQEEMLMPGPSLDQKEWNGPTRGGKRPEPTRYGDWERKGRISDF